ncbi:DUF2313 domain-containing protein [Vibrio europaeus]|uniref:YmfQ family protein n=1 Tax=Vibrio europaeus TaxID=300876 RepID=UPI00233F4679|nr:putative phage tail protein [Vibrio europaeus]MDC5753869.1 DUF2313 domain-containing protein [Vibrio europaeus]MDC5776781.1 DUF2313 domain-containing protein [Vibrio europaeus]MDC5796797.1 DUF2313 domain-containing protein [Vibrio europaeus]MDC5801794.1 DUF2313 domain-containing protein [Vibrio europaeus]MDC5815767.1 DUF2313 domain-containing protein [Vibrio europaeus]
MGSLVICAQSQEAWLDALTQLMPRGMAWNNQLDSGQTKLLSPVAKALSETDHECDKVAAEILPSNTYLLLDEREQYLGLPECEYQGQTIVERRNAIVTKDKQQGGLATWQIEEFAANLGFEIKVEELFPHHCLRSCGYALVPQRYRHILKVKVLNVPNAKMTVLDNVLTPLSSNDARVLECTLNKYKMGGKYYEFIYSKEE